MAMFSRTLSIALIFQLLVEKAAPTEIGKNSIRGRRDPSDDKIIKRNLVEQPRLEEEERNFPFIASLMDDSFNHVCGATFVSDEMLLTAASCQNGRRLSYVHFHDGAANQDSTLFIADTFPNPDYNPITGEHNTMLVKLTAGVRQLISSAKDPSDIIVQVMLNDPNAGRPSNWPVPILKEGQDFIGFNYQHDKNDAFEDEWRDWKMPYLGRENCRSEIAGRGVFENKKFNTPEDSFCLSRPSFQLLDSSTSQITCQHGELGAPILWKSDTTGAQLLVGINTWGVGCRDLALPDLASLANASGNFIRQTVCSESAMPPTYMGCPQETEEAPVVASSAFNNFFSSPQAVTGRSANFFKSDRSQALFRAAPDPVTVYLLFLFDEDASKNIVWTIREAFTKKVVKTARKGTYESQSDFTELVRLVPGKTYELIIDDDSIASTRERFRGKITELALVLAEPPQQFLTGKVPSGSTESFLFRVPKQADSPEVIVGEALSLGQSDTPSVSPMTAEPSSTPSASPIDSSDVTTVVPSLSPSSSPSELPVDFPSFSPSGFPSSVTPSSMIPSSPPMELTGSPSSSPSTPQTPTSDSTCSAKGQSCGTSADCCNGRCSPSKICFAPIDSGRQRVAPGTTGGSAGVLSRKRGVQTP